MKSVVALLGLCCAIAAAQPPEKVLWGGLQPGPYPVGFQSVYALDPARDYDPDYPADAGAPRAKKPRPIFIAYWYPARKSSAPRLTYREYLQAHQPGPRLADFAARLAAYNHDVTCAEIAGKDIDDMSAADRAACDPFLSTRTFASRDVPPAAGSFPVVVYHAGLSGSFEDDSVLCEYLASHGYAVFTTAFQNADSTLMNISWDLSTSFQDTAFLLRFAGTLPFADTTRVAAVGHSFGSQASLAWHAEPNSPLDAVVVLDTTVEYGTLDWPGFAPLKLQLTQGRHGSAPVLLFASRAGRPRFDTFDEYLRFAPRYEATVEYLEHSDYISHGAVGKTLRLDRSQAEAVRRSYDRVCVHVLQFLDACVKHDGQARKWLERSTRGEGLDEAFQLRFREPRPLPPTGRQILSLLDRQGPAKTRELLRSMEGDVERDTLLLAGKTLWDTHRIQDAATVLTWATELFPQSAQVQQFLGDVLKAERAAAKAKAAYERALALIPGDPDLSDPERVDAREEIQEALEALDREP